MKMFPEVSDGFWVMLVAITAFSFGRYFPIDSIVRGIVEEKIQFEERCRVAIENSRIALLHTSMDWMCVEKIVFVGSSDAPLGTAVFEKCEPFLEGGIVRFRPVRGCRLSFTNCKIPFGSLAYLRFKGPDEHLIESDSPWGNLLVPVPLTMNDFNHHLWN